MGFAALERFTVKCAYPNPAIDHHGKRAAMPIGQCLAPNIQHGKWTRFLAFLCGVSVTLCFSKLQSSRASSSSAPDQTSVIVVVGAAGEEEFGKQFKEWAGLWEKACQSAGAKWQPIGLEPAHGTNDLAELKKTIEAEPKDGLNELWLVLLGHGTFDGREARFNLRGPDLVPSELAEWLKPIRRPVAILNTASASAPFINALSAPGRVIVSATRSGHEQNYARLGKYLSEALASTDADLDKDGQVSILELFLTAASGTRQFYETEGRLATEHALIDDNGDGLGTPADWFRGVRATKQAREGAALDGLFAHQFHLIRSEQEKKLPPEIRAKRNELEREIARLREQKKQMTEEEYYRRLEELLVKLAGIYENNH
jgi:hypothetical protein